MNELHRSIEAILMVVDEPVTETTLATILEQTIEEVEKAISELVVSFEGRGFELKKSMVAGASIAILINPTS